MDKEEVMYTHTHTHVKKWILLSYEKNEYYSAKKKWNLAICSDVDGTREYNTL